MSLQPTKRETNTTRQAKYEPVWGSDSDARVMHEQAEHWRKTFDQQVEGGLKLAAEYKPGFYGRPTFAAEIRKRARSNRYLIRSWHAWGEPSTYGKAVCERLKVECRIYAAIYRTLRNASHLNPVAPNTALD